MKSKLGMVAFSFSLERFYFPSYILNLLFLDTIQKQARADLISHL